MGERQVLSVTQECECQTVLMPEIILGDLWYLVPVGILTGGLLEVDPALPTMVPADERPLPEGIHALRGSGGPQGIRNSPTGAQSEKT